MYEPREKEELIELMNLRKKLEIIIDAGIAGKYKRKCDMISVLIHTVAEYADKKKV